MLRVCITFISTLDKACTPITPHSKFSNVAYLEYATLLLSSPFQLITLLVASIQPGRTHRYALTFAHRRTSVKTSPTRTSKYWSWRDNDTFRGTVLARVELRCMRSRSCRFFVLLLRDDPLLTHPGISGIVSLNEEAYNDPQIEPQNNYGGWVNPEDLPPMPQCIAQQDSSAWLEVMTRCISKGCTRHFGIICTHHQWLARLDCLRTDFTTDLVRQYFPYCSRSILAKAQLFSWINTITGRTWLVEVGDSPEVHTISPHSLIKGYMDYDVVKEAPTCLRASSSVATMESFQHIASSCTFTGKTKHTGNTDRPWEYRENAQSVVALDSETAGYNLSRQEIPDGLYIDKECLCTSYTIDTDLEPCESSARPVDQTRKRLWMMATCGFHSILYT
ncbi:hypothetical protein DE146DRAFT_526364 [Phaeosphaeria sp. MPI-PUGE-AT-0046c]|nr:hypothetical protein DE146DRAFT_526364 [Phaeosphaeria sp. MPI-PUGE-AT-0046c]